MVHTELKAESISCGYDDTIILNSLDLTIPSQKINVIIGANGCGKSTLLKALARLLTPHQGMISLNGKDIRRYPSKVLAQRLGLLPQASFVPEGIRVAELVARGRYPYQKPFHRFDHHDHEAIEEAMRVMNIDHLAQRYVDELSGGQRQRVWIALALAQNTDILLLDEPTTYLDIAYQIEILDALMERNRRQQTTIVMVLHDINLSARYGDHLIAMVDGAVLAQGTPNAIITGDLMKQVYGLECSVLQDPITKRPWILPKGQHHNNGASLDHIA